MRCGTYRSQLGGLGRRLEKSATLNIKGGSSLRYFDEALDVTPGAPAVTLTRSRCLPPRVQLEEADLGEGEEKEGEGGEEMAEEDADEDMLDVEVDLDDGAMGHGGGKAAKHADLDRVLAQSEAQRRAEMDKVGAEGAGRGGVEQRGRHVTSMTAWRIPPCVDGREREGGPVEVAP